MELTQSYLKEYLSYESGTGIFTWIKSYRNQRLGKIVGMIDRDGYRTITFKRKHYRAHRLAWFYVYGKWPNIQIDHIDGIRDNNSIDNLREVSFAGNSQNQRKSHADSKYGLIGIDKLSHRKLFRARISINGKRKTLGYFKTPEEAHIAYLEAKRKHHPTCTI
jgi:hypothetical protein